MLALDVNCVNHIFDYLCVNDGICLALTCKRVLHYAGTFVARVKAMTPKQLARDDASIMFRKCVRDKRAAYTASKYDSTRMLRKFTPMPHYGQELLNGACRRGNVAMVDAMRAFINSDALRHAGKSDSTEFVEHIIDIVEDGGSACSAEDSGWSCMIGALMRGNVQMVQFLIALGFIGVPQYDSFPPGKRPKYDCVRILAERCAHSVQSINSKYKNIDISGLANSADVIATMCCGLVEMRKLDILNEVLPRINNVTGLFIDAVHAGWRRRAPDGE